MKSMQKGFTLIELMIVVAIIAILAAIAIPAYQNYITKTQFAESVTIADGLKTPIVEYYNQTGACPSQGTGLTNSGGIGAPTSYIGKYVASATVGTSVTAGQLCPITVAFKTTQGSVSAPLLNQSVTFNGTNNGGTFTWNCVPTTAISPKYVPTACTQ